MKNSLFIALILTGMVFPSLSARDYFFLATEDNFFENPENWFPQYPGTLINKDDRLVIQADVYFEGYNLEISGTLDVTLGSVVTSSSGSIIINAAGAFHNEGDVRVFAINNYGKFDNNIAATVHVQAFSAYRNSVTNNLISASFISIRDVANWGTINNYGYFAVGKDLENRHLFNHMGHAELSVQHILYLGPDSKINASPSSVTHKGREVKIPTMGTLVRF